MYILDSKTLSELYIIIVKYNHPLIATFPLVIIPFVIRRLSFKCAPTHWFLEFKGVLLKSFLEHPSPYLYVYIHSLLSPSSDSECQGFNLFIRFILFLLVFFLHIYLCTAYVQSSQRVIKGITSIGITMIVSCHGRDEEFSLGPLEELSVFFPTEPLSRPQSNKFYV